MVVQKTQTRPVTIIDVYIDTPPTENIIENILEEKKRKKFCPARDFIEPEIDCIHPNVLLKQIYLPASKANAGPYKLTDRLMS